MGLGGDLLGQGRDRKGSEGKGGRKGKGKEGRERDNVPYWYFFFLLPALPMMCNIQWLNYSKVGGGTPHFLSSL